MMQPRCFTFSQSECTPHTAPRSPLPSHHKHARADTHDATSPTHHNGTSASGCVPPKTAHANKPRTAHRTLTHSIQTHKPRTPARHPAQLQQHRTAPTSLHAHRRAHATHSAAHSSDHPTHRPQKITPSHTRGLRATLTAELSGCPASTGCYRRVGCRSSTSTCRTHEQPSRHTMAPDAAADPSQPPATHLSASHSINQTKPNQIKSNQIKSNDKPVSTLHAIAHAQHRARVTPKRRNQTAHRYLTPSSHHTSQRHCDARASHNATTATPCTCQQALGTQQQQLQTASESREGCARRTATRRRLTAET
jgi:hypothetical protein